MGKISARLLLILLAAAGAGLAASAHGIIIRHDRLDTNYVVSEKDYPEVFYLHYRYNNKVCMATLISAQWAITAGHCTEQTPLRSSIENEKPYEVTIGGEIYSVAELVLHPDYHHPHLAKAVDLALIKLDRAVVTGRPASLYRKTDENHQILSFLGWGYTGVGTRGRMRNDGKLRRAYNTVIAADQWLVFRFDDPRLRDNEALHLEGIPGLGDSGGPAFLATEEGMQLVGVALGQIENDRDLYSQGRYGTLSLYERISTHYDWIRATALDQEAGK